MITIGATFDKMLKQRIFMIFNGNMETVHTYSLQITATKSHYAYAEAAVINGTLLRDNLPLPNALIVFYKDGSTLVGTAITDAGGEFSKEVDNLTIGSHSILAYYGSTESNTVTVTTDKIVTTLNISVPLNIVYSDAFNITGTLTSAYDGAMANKQVKLKVGSSVVDTQTTNSNGVVTFTRTPVTMGNHSFQLVYDGDPTYASVNSTTVTREVNKETSVLNITSPTNNSSIYTDGSFSVNGSLVSDDNEKLSSKTVKLKEGNTTIATYTTNSNGAFSGTVSGLALGTHSLRFVFEGDTNYATSYVNRTIIVNQKTDPSLNLYGYVSSENYNSTIVENGVFIVTVIDDYFNEGSTLYSSVYDSLVLTVYDSNNNVVNVPYESNIYNDARIYTMLYGASTPLSAGNYKIEVVSPATIYHERKVVTLNITIGVE